MEIPKDKILQLLRERGQDDKAQQADNELPDQVDPEQHAGLLSKLGLDPGELLKLVGGGGGLGGLGDKLALGGHRAVDPTARRAVPSTRPAAARRVGRWTSSSRTASRS